MMGRDLTSRERENLTTYICRFQPRIRTAKRGSTHNLYEQAPGDESARKRSQCCRIAAVVSAVGSAKNATSAPHG
jgi:hypothetical protein